MVADGFTYYISNSELQTWKRCRRKWWLSWYRRFTPKLTDYASKRQSGSRIHEVLAHWYSPTRPNNIDMKQLLHEVIERDRQSLVEEMQRVHAEELLQIQRMHEFNSIVSFERAMIEGYMQWIEETAVDAEFEVISPETAMIVPLDVLNIGNTHIDVNAIGIIDVRVRRTFDGKRAILDHKTVASLTQPFETIRQNEQMLHYILLETIATHGIIDSSNPPQSMVVGAYYNMIRRVKRTAAAKPPFFGRIFIPHSPVELESYRQHLLGAVEDMIRAGLAVKNGASPQRVMYPSIRSECSWDCDFFSLCHLFDDGSHPEAMLEARYMKHNPLDRYLTALNKQNES